MILFWFFAGAVLGWFTIYFQIWNVAQLGPHMAANTALVLVIGGALVRWSMVAILFWAALQIDVVSCLMSFAGLWLARRWMLYRVNDGSVLLGFR